MSAPVSVRALSDSDYRAARQKAVGAGHKPAPKVVATKPEPEGVALWEMDTEQYNEHVAKRTKDGAVAMSDQDFAAVVVARKVKAAAIVAATRNMSPAEYAAAKKMITRGAR